MTQAPSSPATTIEDAVDELADVFDILGDWEERYRHLLEMGRDLTPLDDEERTEANKVRGCASQVWLVRDPDKDGRLYFRGDSDAHLVRGLVALVLQLYGGRSAAEIFAFDAPAAFARLGLSGALTSQRANGLAAMVGRIRSEAAAAAGA